jgi:hypothetical protein
MRKGGNGVNGIKERIKEVKDAYTKTNASLLNCNGIFLTSVITKMIWNMVRHIFLPSHLFLAVKSEPYA